MSTNALTHIFAEDDKIFICNIGEQGTKNEFVGNPAQVQEELIKNPRLFFAISPMKGQRRLKNQIQKYQSFLFESDTMPLSDQYLLAEDLRKSGLVSMATYSGSKSIHFIVSVADTLKFGEPGSDHANDLYRRTWLGLERLFREFGLTGIDQTNKNPVTLSRMPGQMRGETEQTLLYTGPLQTAEFISSLTIPARQSTIVPVTNVNNLPELEIALENPKHAKLKLAIQYPANFLNAHHGNYPLLFRYAAWLIDETNAPADAAIAYFQKYFVPHLQAKNYFKDWEKPILHAYRHKGIF